MGLIKPRIKVRVALARCGNCNKTYSNPLTHVCVKKASQTAKRNRKKK